MIQRTATALGFLTLLAVPTAGARAQWGCMGGWVGYGSTVQGDIARGEGVFLSGLGTYNVDTAIAGSINANTWMRLNSYIAAVITADNDAKAEHRRAKLQQKIESHKDTLDRLRNNPELLDLHKGDALNRKLEPLLDPKVPESAYRFATVAVPGEVIRQIPFKIGKEGATFSMDRLMARGEWPVALRNEKQFGRECKAYGDAVDVALDEMVRGKLSRGAVEAVRAAVTDLQYTLDRVAPPQREHDDLYLKAKNYLRELETVGRILAIPEVERVLGAIERYHGTTVGDLLKFMHDQDVRFGVARSDVERDLYRDLYAALLQQSNLFDAARQLAEVKAVPRAREKAKAGQAEDETLH